MTWLFASTIDWLVGGAITLVLATFGIYRFMTRLRDWGPRDT